MQEYLSVAIEAARQAGEIQRKAFTQPLTVREATRYDIKLQTDVDCEEQIRSLIRDAFPSHEILGEEYGGSISATTPTWIIDPLDGTVNFAHHIPHFCTSIALQLDGRFVVGVIYDPMRDELFTAQDGGGAYLNSQRISVSAITKLSAAAVAMGFSKSVETLRTMLTEMNDLAHAVQKVRIFGAAALDLAYVAAGRLDGFLEYGLKTWDIAAGTLLIREAGGRVTLADAGRQAWNVHADNGHLL